MVDIQDRTKSTEQRAEVAKTSTSDRPDVRTLIPPLGLREYWYPAIEDKKVKNKPVGLKLLGDDVVFFRGKDGKVAALWNVCPHRGGHSCMVTVTLKGRYRVLTMDGRLMVRGTCLRFFLKGQNRRFPAK